MANIRYVQKTRSMVFHLALFISGLRGCCPSRGRSSATDSSREHRSRNPSGRRRTSVRSNCLLALLSGLGGRRTPTGLHYPPLLHIAAVVGQKRPNPTYQHLPAPGRGWRSKGNFLAENAGWKTEGEGTRVELEGEF